MSKGITDLGGMGKLVGECRKFVMDMIRHWAERDTRKLKNQQLTLQNQAQDIKNKAEVLQLMQLVSATSKKCGYSPQELQEFITSMTSTQQITTVKPKEVDVQLNPRSKLLGE
jgi:hypothetical protein